MCECGCTGNDEHYTFPGPGKTFYILTLSGGCTGECDAGPGVTIERIKPGDFMHSKENREAFTDGPLKFEKWPDSEGVAICTGPRQHEFIDSIKSHLIGVSSAELGDDAGTFDEIGAETLLEEAYPDSVYRPRFPKAEAQC
jgi:hypothetical protein